MSRAPHLPGLVSLVASVLIGCGPVANTAPRSTGHYSDFRNPFPVEAPPYAPAEPAKPADPAATASKNCGPACGMCSRASETCDEEIRTTGQWNGPQCRRKESICGPLLALQKATGCSCE